MSDSKRALRAASILTLALATAAWPAATRAEAPTAPGGEALSAEQARTVFTRLKALAGGWESASTEGWKGTENVQVIAKGSAILVTSSFADTPEEAMATVFHLDGDRLLLTHYCEARNQPRLVASRISPDGNTVTFSFLDATNLPSRDHGHMDSMVLRFEDADHFTSHWTWYQDGASRWLEEIRSRRASGTADR